MNTSRISRRTLLVGLIGAITVALLAMVVVVVLAMGRLSEWGSTAIDKVKGATATVVAQSGDEAARALQDARTSVERTREVIADPQAALDRAVDGVIDSATQDVTRSVAVATAAATAAATAGAAAAAPAITGRIDAANDALNALAGPDPQPWPQGLALRQTQFRQDGAVAEYAYVSLAPGFDLAGMRRDLAGLGYAEYVLALDASRLEAMYRGERELLLTATLRDGLHHITVRDVTAPTTP